MASVAEILCWVNTSEDPEKSTVWLKPVEQTPLLTNSVFVNLPNKAGQRRFADLIRGTFASHSYQIILDLGSVKVSPKGSMSISVDFETLGKTISVLEKSAVEETVDPAEDSFFASLPQPTPSAVSSITEDF
jgi:hypothetical protein